MYLQIVRRLSALRKEIETEVLVSCIFSVLCLRGNAKEPTQLSLREAHGVSGWPYLTGLRFT